MDSRLFTVTSLTRNSFTFAYVHHKIDMLATHYCPFHELFSRIAKPLPVHHVKL